MINTNNTKEIETKTTSTSLRNALVVLSEFSSPEENPFTVNQLIQQSSRHVPYTFC